MMPPPLTLDRLMTNRVSGFAAFAPPLQREYGGLLPAQHRIAEPAGDPLSEGDLSAIWAGQRFPPEALSTPDGRSVRVLHPGRRTGGPGPDFRDAVVSVGGIERRGDVELHVRASSFYSHGHGRDAAYARLALHVVYLADDGPETQLALGGSVPVAAFAPWLQYRTSELQRWLSAPDAWAEPCRDVALRLGDAAVDETLQRFGEERFHDRVLRMAETARRFGEEEALWRALADALGVGGDREAFRELAVRWPAAASRAAVLGLPADAAVEALTAGLMGMLRLDARAAASCRPANRPQRRLRALAALFVRSGGDLACFARATVAEAGKAQQLLARWQVGGEPALLGPERARELLVNAVLPFAALDPSLQPRALALLAALPPGAAYGRTRFLEHNLRRADGKQRRRDAVVQQGLLGLLNAWCSQGGCGRCPLS
jgi:hypothetical protein